MSYDISLHDPVTREVIELDEPHDMRGGTFDKWADPSMFTHTKPEPPDSWDALWDNIEDCAVGYESFMRRCRALAEQERGE